MDADNKNIKDPSYDELRIQNSALRAQLEQALPNRQYIWMLFVETSRRLQISSASIKAAVSSLLNYDLFWDPANQHEFLETIDTSVDKVSRLVVLLALAFRAEAGSLEIKREPQSLQEILAVVQANATTKNPKLKLRLSLPKEGKPVLVDYEYLTIALEYLFELLAAGQKAEKIQIRAVENPNDWFLDIDGLDEADLDLIHNMHYCKTDQHALSRYSLVPEMILGLHVACEIFHLHEIELERAKVSQGEPILRLVIPAFITNPMES